MDLIKIAHAEDMQKISYVHAMTMLQKIVGEKMSPSKKSDSESVYLQYSIAECLNDIQFLASTRKDENCAEYLAALGRLCNASMNNSFYYSGFDEEHGTLLHRLLATCCDEVKLAIHFEFLDLTVSNRLGRYPLHVVTSCSVPSCSLIQKLIAAGAAVNCTDLDGNTPLHLACKNKDVSHRTIATLINSGCDIFAMNAAHESPIDYLSSPEMAVEANAAAAVAAARHNQETSQLLLSTYCEVLRAGFQASPYQVQCLRDTLARCGTSFVSSEVRCVASALVQKLDDCAGRDVEVWRQFLQAAGVDHAQSIRFSRSLVEGGDASPRAFALRLVRSEQTLDADSCEPLSPWARGGGAYIKGDEQVLVQLALEPICVELRNYLFPSSVEAPAVGGGRSEMQNAG